MVERTEKASVMGGDTVKKSAEHQEIDRFIAQQLEYFLGQEVVSVETAKAFYQKAIFDMAETGYLLDLNNSTDSLNFIHHFNNSYCHFVREKNGCQEDILFWQTLADLITEKCLKPEDIGNAIERAERELGSVENLLSEPEKEELQRKIDTLSVFNILIAVPAMQRDTGLEEASTPYIDKNDNASFYPPEKQLSPETACAIGEIEKALNDFHIESLRAAEEAEFGMTHDFAKKFFGIFIPKMVSCGFELDILNNEYHRGFLNTFTQTFRICVIDNEDLRDKVQKEFFWMGLSDLLIRTSSLLEPQNIKGIIKALEERKAMLGNKEDRAWNDEIYNIQDSQIVLEDFDTIVHTYRHLSRKQDGIFHAKGPLDSKPKPN